MRQYMVMGLLAGLMSPTIASAAAWETKTMQPAFAPREVERSLNIGKGWLEFTFGADVKNADGYWDSEGNAVAFDNAKWLYSTEYVSMRYGLLNRVEINARMPFHYLQLTNDLYGTDTSGVYMGDPHLGLLFELLRTDAPLTSVVAIIDFKMPAGNESPGSQIAGPSTFESFVVSTGTHDLTLGAAAKRQISILSVELNMGWTHRVSALAQYVIETDQNQFAGRIKPGDQLRADLKVTAQLGPLALHVSPKYLTWEEVMLGTSSGQSDGGIGVSLFPNRNLEAVEGSDGWSLNVETGVTLHASKALDINLGVDLPIRGEDLMFYPLEEIHPTKGMTYSGSLEVRY